MRLWTDDAFLQAIHSAPDDDTPRLVYADWLEEHDQADRATFIRVQCQLALLPGDDPRRAELEARERQLLEDHEEEWAGELPRVVTRRRFERGFLAGVEMPGKGFSQLPAVFGVSPTVRHVSLHGPFRSGRPSLRVIADSPYLARLGSLEIRDGYYGVGPTDVAVLAASPHVGGLTSLSLHNNAMGAGGLAVIAASPYLCRLTTLSPSCYGFNRGDYLGGGIGALAASPHLVRLTTLRLRRCGVGDEGCRVLAAADGLACLSTLDLSANQVGDPGAEALAVAPPLARLVRLDLRDNYIPKSGRKRLRARFGDRVCL